MADAKFYVRSRGKITGPFDVETLTKLVRRGMLTAVDEISENRQSWSRAAEYQDLFPVRQPVAHAARSNQEAESPNAEAYRA